MILYQFDMPAVILTLNCRYGFCYPLFVKFYFKTIFASQLNCGFASRQLHYALCAGWQGEFRLIVMHNLGMLGKYRIIGELGRGAMGIVYEAFDTLIERTVAIKTILKSSVNSNESDEIFSRFRSEARAAGRLSHPKIIGIYEYSENDEMAYIVMELVRGKELTEYFDHGRRMSIGEGLRIVTQLLDALDYLHAHGIVHRDIKPANIMLTEDVQVKLADFGIAKIDSSGHTQVGVVLGTPTYMAPEQFMGHEVDRRADLYAAGVILYLILTGQRPFVGSVIAIMHQAVHRDAPPPSGLNSVVTAELDAVVKKAMAKRPEDRYQSAKKFLRALKAAAQTLPAADHPGVTMLRVDEMHPFDETLELPGRANSTGSWREDDIEAWQNVSYSQNPADFIHYLQKFPDGGFAQSARLRLQSLEQAAVQAKLAKQQAQALKEKEQIQTQAELAARMKREAEERALWTRKLAQIKSEAEDVRVIDAARREQEAAEQAQRAKALSVTLSERANKLAEIVSERAAAQDAERKMRIEAKRQLEEEVQRKKQAKMQLMSARESVEASAEAGAVAKRQREAAELAARDEEIAAAKEQAKMADLMRREAEERAAREQRQTSNKMLVIGIFLVLLLIGIVFDLLPSSK
jgi:serine/threonine protein kinase